MRETEKMQTEWEWLCATKHLFCLQHSSFVCPLKGKPAICCKWDKSMWSLLASGSRKTKLWSGTKLCFFIHFKSRKIFATNCYTKMVFFFLFQNFNIWVQLLRDGYGIFLHLPQTCSRYDALVVKQINNNNWTLSQSKVRHILVLKLDLTFISWENLQVHTRFCSREGKTTQWCSYFDTNIYQKVYYQLRMSILSQKY